MTRMLYPALLLVMIHLVSVPIARADLNQYLIRTTEWLVDHSSAICVAEFPVDGAESNPRVLRTLKGTPDQIAWPLKEPPFDGYLYYGPSAKGAVRLLFIGGENRLLQAVDLRRFQYSSPTLHDVFYGVDQYGTMHLTESSLFDGIRAHLAARPSPAVARRRDSPHFERSGIEAPAGFPLECGDETFVLVVDFTSARRNHFLAQIQDGDCAERVHAIHELSQLDDPRAMAALKDATRATGVEPSYVHVGSDQLLSAQADDVVRSAAAAALERLRRAP